MQADALIGGFSDPAIQSAHAFREVMQAMARPGSRHSLQGVQAPEPLSSAAGTVLLTLCDADTPIYLAGDVDTSAVRSWLAFHTGAPFAGPAHCMFAVGTWEALAPLSAYTIGSPEFPDRSATLIVELDDLTDHGATLTGPGIQTNATLSLPDVKAFQNNHAHFPLGLDFIFTSGVQIAALPRSTEVV